MHALCEGIPIAKKIFGYLSVREVLVVTWPYICPSVHPYVRTTGQPMWKSRTFQLVWEPATWYCTSMLWSIIIDSCQNRVSADQYHITVLQTQVSSRRGCVFLKLSADKLLVFNLSQAQLQVVVFFTMVTKFIVWGKL